MLLLTTLFLSCNLLPRTAAYCNMVVASLSAAPAAQRVRELDVPVVDFSWRRERVSGLVLRACEEFGFFKVVNHGLPENVIVDMEKAATEFFAMNGREKQLAGPPTPLGYGVRNIGLEGDAGELEYLLLHTNPAAVSQRARTICRKNPTRFSSVVNGYAQAIRNLTCKILDMLGEELGLENREAISGFIRDNENDSLLRLNHYPPCSSSNGKDRAGDRVGFGEHSDPQILTVLRSNDVPGLQFVVPSTEGEVWVPAPPDPKAFYVIVGDVLQAISNGRLVSVKHRAMANSYCSRFSTIYFGAPPVHARISPLPETVTSGSPRQYKSFTWGDFKKAMYSLRLGCNRLSLYRVDGEELNTGLEIR